MEDSTLLVERTKNKFYETKNLVNTKLGDHLNRSRSLLSDVNSSLRKSIRDDSVYSQRYFVDSFVPFKENGFNDHYRYSSDSFNCSTRLTSPTFMSKNNSALGLSETPKHMTQAKWLLNTANVSCKLSNNLLDEKQEKIPDILLKDPADLLKGDDKNSQVKNEDKLTELLKDKYQDSDKTDLRHEIQDKYKNSISYDIVSTLDFSKKTVNNNNVYGSNETVNKLLNDSYNNLEKLSQMLNSNQNSFKGFENFCKNKNNWNDNFREGDKSYNKLNEMFTQEFVNNSGIDFKQQSDALTETLLKLNEQDKLKETELAPKVFLIDNNTDNNNTNNNNNKLEETKFKNESVLNVNSGITGLETDLLGSFTIIKDDKTGRKMYRLSDFDQKFKATNKSSNSVQIQTEFPDPEPVVSKKNYTSNVKVVYHNLYEGKNDMCNKENNLKKQDLYAQQLVSNLVPRVEMKMENYYENNKDNNNNTNNNNNNKEKETKEEENKQGKNVLNKVKEYNEWIKTKDEEKMKSWRLQREPIFDLINLNFKSGVKASTMCRGGRRNTTIVHKSKLVRPNGLLKNNKDNYNNTNNNNNTNTNKEKENTNKEMYYISPSNRKSIENDEYYGYDFGYEDLENTNNTNNEEKYRMVVNNMNSEVNNVNKKNLNPLEHFEQWWSINTEELNMLREQLSM